MLNEKDLFKRKLLVLIISLAVLICLLFIAEKANKEIKIEDPKLEEVIREKIEKPTGPIYQSELSNIISLDASNREITNLNGIERVYRLAEINLENNKIEDLTPLSKLKMLKVLNLNNNGITDLEEVNFKTLSRIQLREIKMRNNLKTLDNGNVVVLSNIKDLEKMRSLEELDLRYNNIQNIEPLSSLTSLTKLNLRGNNIVSLEPISKLKRLEYLNIHSNENIETVLPLSKLINLETLIMKNVDIDDVSVFENLRKLQNLNAVNCGLTTTDNSSITNLFKDGVLQGDVRPEFLKITIDVPVFSHTGGFYDEEIELKLKSTSKKSSIYYTADGSIPTKNSAKYIDGNPIKIKKGSRATTISARVISNDEKYVSAMVANTYFISKGNEYKSTLPIISIVTDERNLFDEEIGIYTENNMNNRGIEWERPIHIEFFETNRDRKIAQNAGIRLHGGCSRDFEQKSFKLYADDSYNKLGNFKYDIFKGLTKIQSDKNKNKFKRLILRNSGQDYNFTMFRDALMQSIVAPLNSVDTQAYRSAVVYINGEYWGIYNIRERYDEYYFAETYNVSPKDITILELNAVLTKGKNTDVNHYKEMLAYIENNGLANKNDYDYIKTQMDVENYRDYVISQTYFANADWPHNNIKFWRYKTDKYKKNVPYGQDGRWRWILYDTDGGFGIHSKNDNLTDALGNKIDKSHNTISWINTEYNSEKDNPRWPWMWSTCPNFLFRSLIENYEFKVDFLNRYADFLNVYASPDLVLNRIDEMQAGIEPEMEKHIERWGAIESMEEWYENIDVLREFAIDRPKYVRQHLVNEFNLEGEYTLNLESNSKKGYVKVNTVDIEDFKWSGVYFKNVPLTIEAFNNDGQTFLHWEVNGKIYINKKITISPKENVTIKAVYKN